MVRKQVFIEAAFRTLTSKDLYFINKQHTIRVQLLIHKKTYCRFTLPANCSFDSTE